MNDFLENAELNSLSDMDVRMMNPLKLAFLGDAIYEAYIRTYLISQFVMTPHEMSKKAKQFVNANAQATAVHRLRESFSEDEWQMIKRGRNQKSSTVPKNALLSDYRYATGYEALIGYLYLTDRKERLYEIVHLTIKAIDSKENSIKDLGEHNET
ncbi:MAG: Mini-ribonuclease 3 [Clostridia bacterium]|nr:Mini-ribonuclease 3 [Clostridia bacterium]